MKDRRPITAETTVLVPGIHEPSTAVAGVPVPLPNSLPRKKPARRKRGRIIKPAGADRSEALLKPGALQNAIFNSANFSSIATDAKGVIQIFNVGAEKMLGYTAAEVMNKITPADISDPQ